MTYKYYEWLTTFYSLRLFHVGSLLWFMNIFNIVESLTSKIVNILNMFLYKNDITTNKLLFLFVDC